MNKKIGIVGWRLGENSFGVTLPYLRYIQQFGDPIILSPSNRYHKLDLLVLPGGSDLSSYHYNEPPGYFNSQPDLYKEFFFSNNLKKYIENGVPVFGICLGMQMLNVHFGGKLTQHLFGHPYSEKNRYDEAHALHFTEEYEYLDVDKSKKKKNKKGQEEENLYQVNSLHHQGVCLNIEKDRYTLTGSDLADPLKLVAYSTDGVVEVVEHETLPIAGVQYHPEELYFSDEFQDKVSVTLINKLLNGSKNTGRKAEAQVAEAH